jgi:hypothetical protein
MNRRMMSAVLQTPDLPDAASAFLAAGNPKPLLEKVAPATMPPPEPLAEAPGKPESPAEPRFRLDRVVPDQSEPGLVCLTVRVPRHVPPGLLLASVERKLQRQRPFTQQEIVAEAITHWLKSHGYVS